MSDDRPPRRFQYSLLTLLGVTTLVAVLCSVGVCTHWLVPAVIFVGLGICLIGFGPLSSRKHPEAGDALAVAGFFVRLAGLLVVTFGLLLYLARVAWQLR
jgi:hypothetical protein